ncbi:MAG: tetratricopeptide repeat protein, partial [Balneolaceae bacterium]
SFTILPGTFSAVAQEQTFQEANRLLQQEKLDEARALFEDLYSENPDGGIFFDRLMEVLERLRDYERAIEVAETRINERGASPQVSLRIAELYHASGDSTEAAERWNRLAEEHSSNIQTLYNIGNSLMQRSEYRHAIEHYNLARERLNNPGLFAPEIANARLHSGDIRGAMREYADLLAENPNQLFSIQQRLVRIQDNDVMRAAALEVEDRFASMAADHPSYSSVSQLLIWLLMETEQHRRAMVAARRFESSTENIHFSLYSLANQLLSIEEYELAAEAYDYYIESAPPPFNHQAMEEKASVYIHWAAWLDEHLLESVQRRVELLEEAYELNNTLLEMDSEYRYRD